MPQLGVWELLIVLVIVLLIFGASRLTGIGKGLGGAINAFRSEVKQGREKARHEQSARARDGTARGSGIGKLAAYSVSRTFPLCILRNTQYEIQIM